MDDIKITTAAAEVPEGEEGLRTDFEDGTLQGWKNRIGPESLSVSQILPIPGPTVCWSKEESAASMGQA